MARLKRETKIYLLAAGSFVVLLVGAILDKGLPSTTSGYLLFAGAVFSALVSIFGFLSILPPFKRIKIRINRLLGIDEEGTEPLPAVNPKKLEQFKDVLLGEAYHRCKLVLEDIEKNSVIFSAGGIIKTKRIYYENFKSFLERRKASYPDSNKLPETANYAIVGEPGNGKTYTLFRAIMEKIEKVSAERKNGKFDSEIPVYLSLNTWDKHVDFNDWLNDVIAKEYKSCIKPKGFSKCLNALVGKHEIIAFVDGLDEVDSEKRLECFKALLDYEGIGLVFSCRKEELMALISQIDDQDATFNVVELQPLSWAIITDTIIKTKANHSEIISFLESRDKLIDYVRMPLMLNVFLKVYDSLSLEAKERMKSVSQEEFEDLLFEKYDEVMFTEKFEKSNFKLRWSVTAVRTYMVWLARKMSGNSFFIEEIQPSWLEKPRRILLYYLTSRIISGGILAIGVGLFIAGPTDFLGNGVFAAICIVVLTLVLNRIHAGKFCSKLWMVILFSFTLIILTGLYQGLAVPRKPGDMFMFDKFSVTESFAGILLGLFFGVIFGYRRNRQNDVIDVQPLEHKTEKFKLNLRNAWRTGITGGCCIGLFLGVAAICIHAFFNETTFDTWLVENVSVFMTFTDIVFSEQSLLSVYVQMALFGFMAGFFIGFIVFALLGGRDKETIEGDIERGIPSENVSMFKLNSGIKKSFRYSMIYGVSVFLAVSIFYGMFIFFLTRESESLVRAVSVGFGTGIISLLWFGGFEVIQHWTLRLYLHLYGIVPLRYGSWVKTVVHSALILKVGPSLRFFHGKLQKYYLSIPLNDSRNRISNLQRKKILNISFTLFALASLALLVYPFCIRLTNCYWTKPNETLFKKPGAEVISIGDTAFVFNKTGMLRVSVSGEVKVGTFTGYVNAAGTETGLLGFPITDVYDLEPGCSHGALIYQVVNAIEKKPWKHVIDRTAWTNSASIPLQKGDTIFFKVNDNEHQNNRRHFEVALRFCDTCQQKL